MIFYKSDIMRRTSCSNVVGLNSIELNETWRVARYDKYLGIYFTFLKSDRRIKIYQTKKVKKKHKIMEPSRRQSHLHRYYSSSSSHTELALRVITLRVQAHTELALRVITLRQYRNLPYESLLFEHNHTVLALQVMCNQR